MSTTIRTSLVCTAIAFLGVAATPKLQNRVTAQRVLELTTPADNAAPKDYKVEISALGTATLQAGKYEGRIEAGRELRFPTQFDPPQANSAGSPVVTPTTPTAFETIHTGWTVRLSAKPHGKLVAIYGVADFVESSLVPGGYGAVAGPIYTKAGEVLTSNKLEQPRLQTTTTRFHIFAVPGESYDVTLYRGAKAEKHSITVASE